MSSDHGGYLKMRENGGFLQNFLALEAAWRTRFKFELLLLSSLLIQFYYNFLEFPKITKMTEIYDVVPETKLFRSCFRFLPIYDHSFSQKMEWHADEKFWNYANQCPFRLIFRHLFGEFKKIRKIKTFYHRRSSIYLPAESCAFSLRAFNVLYTLLINWMFSSLIFFIETLRRSRSRGCL